MDVGSFPGALTNALLEYIEKNPCSHTGRLDIHGVLIIVADTDTAITVFSKHRPQEAAGRSWQTLCVVVILNPYAAGG